MKKWIQAPPLPDNVLTTDNTYIDEEEVVIAEESVSVIFVGNEGEDGQTLKKQGNLSVWSDDDKESVLPEDGNVGDVLSKTADGTRWINAKIEGEKIILGDNEAITVMLPEGGEVGQSLAIGENGLEWINGINRIDWASDVIINKPDTLEGYGITDAYIDSTKIVLGENHLDFMATEDEGEPGDLLVKTETGMSWKKLITRI